MSVRKGSAEPSFRLVTKEEWPILEHELRKLEASVEISLAGGADLASGKVAAWNSVRKTFEVAFDHLSSSFLKRTTEDAGLNAFVKIKLFSTQLIFKSTTVRKIGPHRYQYRIPAEVFKQQRRSALRVPLTKGSARLKTREGIYSVLDLSLSGAKLQIPARKVSGNFEDCVLELLSAEKLTLSLSAKLSVQNEHHLGVRFSQLSDESRNGIKHFLLSALREYYFQQKKSAVSKSAP